MLCDDTAKLARHIRNAKQEFDVYADLVTAISRAVEDKNLEEARAEEILKNLTVRANEANTEIFSMIERWARREPVDFPETYPQVEDDYEDVAEEEENEHNDD